MKNKRLIISALLLISNMLIIGNNKGYCQEDNGITIYKYDIREDIGPGAWRLTQKAFAKAEELSVDYILIHMNTYGGTVLDADSIRTKILNSNIPVLVFIDNNAASAGALISIACDSIYIRPGGNIGAATVVSQTGEVMPDKYQSYMRSIMRATAEAQGKVTVKENGKKITRWKRDPAIAEAMVDPSTYIEGVIDSTKVLTFTVREAIENNFCEGEVTSIANLCEKAGIKNYDIVEHKITAMDRIIHFLISPLVHGILIMLIVGGIYFELQSPGIGFPLIAAIFGAVLFFAPLYLEGLAENWEIILFIAGIVLIGVEVFVIPGFGIAGISGIVLLILGLTLSMIGNVVFDFQGVHLEGAFTALAIVVSSIFISIILSIYASKKLLVSSPLSFLVLKSTQQKSEGFVSVGTGAVDVVGKQGVAMTILRPSGKVIVDDEIYDAKADISYINEGEKIEVIRYESGQVYVKKI
ncbi:nodulation protein NfeD [Bacteroidota bacterium]